MAARGILGPGIVPTIMGAKAGHAEPRAAEQRGPILKIMKDESALKSKAGPIGSLKIIDDKWEHTGEKVNQFLSESNVDYQVIGVLGAPGVGKSTILNALYGLASDHPSIVAGRTPPPFAVQSEEARMLARHSSSGVEMRATAERLVLLDSQPVFSPSVLTDITRPDGSSSVTPFPGDPPAAELALEAMALQQAVFLLSVCHVIIVVSEGLEDRRLWELLHAAQLLRDRIYRPLSIRPPTPPSRQSEPVPSQSPRPPNERPGSSSSGVTASQASGRGQPGGPVSQTGPPILSHPHLNPNPKLNQPGVRPSQGDSRPGSAASSREEPQRPSSASAGRPSEFRPPEARRSPEERPQRAGHSPEVVFVATKLRGSELLGGQLRAAQEELTAAFPALAAPRSGPGLDVVQTVRNRTYGPGTDGANGKARRNSSERSRNERLQASGESNAKGELRDSPSVSFYGLPAKGPNSAAFESFHLSLRSLRDQILGIPRRHLLGKPVTEASWLRYTNKVWRDVRESDAVKEYCSLLQSDGFFR
ncbi:putative SMG9 [Klebsormidium nitens]|uniref:Putative SMG9 n=1 Tax=Klebsormidium nitens TaxID=105231 RepID=A0A1Y1IK83_KLENI|nr:putative SMG9 [Klebsormidium nitens]|eukprot:GAQ89077.1 putative SMG9 [Klebsormidium nitens]